MYICEMKRKYLVLFIIGLLVVDQVVKVLVKTNMSIGESIPVLGRWFQIYFIENEGAAFGMKLGGQYGKLVLSLFRIVAVTAIGFYIDHLWKKGAPKGVLLALSMVLAGAMGNIIDSAFYGIVWDYAPFLHGRVVDMFSLSFFPPVFNVADSYISVAVVWLILFHWKYFK